MIKQDVLENCKKRISDTLRYAYDDGYENGYALGREEVRKLRAECTRYAGEKDAEYAENWDDHTLFYGWCSECERPHSGRWAHIWVFCPWCGAKIKHTNDDPYPTGVRQLSKKMQEVMDMCADINPEEIKAHETDESLTEFCGAWGRKMEKLIKAIGEGD